MHKSSLASNAFISLIFFFISSVIYLLVSGKFIWSLEITNNAYFNLLAESFLVRRYDLIHPPANPFDLAIYKGAVYLPWGPLPSIILMPIVKVFGSGVSDRIYTALFGGLNVSLFFAVLLAFRNLVGKKLTFSRIVLLTLLFAFGTVHFSISAIAHVWFTSQIMSMTPFLASILFLFIFLHKKKSIFYIFSILFFTLSIFGKLWYATMIGMYLLTLLRVQISKKQKITLLMTSALILGFYAWRYGLYNWRRFGSYLETGYMYQMEARQYLEARKLYGKYNVVYIAQNIWYQFLKPLSFQKVFPFVKPDPMGNGILFTTPLFLFLIYLRKIKKQRFFITLIFAGIVPYVFQLLFFLGTGFFQFGARYLLEVAPLLILLVALITPYVKKRLIYTFVIVSIIINSLGAVWLVFSY